MSHSLINPSDPLERQNAKLLKITDALMRRVEQSTDDAGMAYAQFQRAALLEEEVRSRTHDLERALDLLNDSNARLAEANRETESARQNLANALESIQEGFALFGPNEALIMCNSRFGMHMPDIHHLLSPGLRFTDYVDAVSKSQFLSLPDQVTPDQWLSQRLMRHKDNHVIFNVRMIWNRWVQVSEHRTPDRGTVIIQTDVTDIMRLERQERDRMLDDQARLIRATLEHLNQGICIFDSQARLVGWNHRVAELLTMPLSRFRIGASFDGLFSQFRDHAEFTHNITPDGIEDWVVNQATRPPLSFEMTLGPTRTLAVFAQEMPDRGFVISFTDITAERDAVRAMLVANETLEQRVRERTLELADALAEAERANSSKSRFVAAASHDLLQPLSAAKLYVASLENDATGEMRDVMGKANRALQSVENILEALLDISKLDSGQAATHIVPVNLGRLLRQLTDELRPIAEAKGIRLRVAPTTLSVMSDPTYLQRIIQNLMTNAVRYTERGTVLVGARRRKGGVRVEIWDTGPGIPEEQHELIFGEFQRLNAAASPSEGMGLGLAIVDRACALLNHPLRLVSTVGRGTGFLVQLPIASPSDTDIIGTPPVFRTRQNDLTGLIVLLVENDPDLRNALSLSLEKWGADVLPCATDADAYQTVQDLGMAPDVIVADYQLDDGILGTQVIETLRADLGSFPACIITANRAPHIAQYCADNDIALLLKPLDAAALRAHLAAVLRSRDTL